MRWNGYEKGVNLGGWLSQCNHTKERYDNFITKEDIAALSTWGIDHVRIPVDYNLVEDNEGNYKESGFAYLQNAIDWCGEYGLNMILDLHKTVGYSFDKGEEESGFFEEEKYQERFYRLWEEFARRYSQYENRLAFELLNEVTDKSCCEKWNAIADTCIRRIRKIAPTVTILVGGYWNNSVDAVKDLALPQDENIVYNFHCYAPLIFTHQGASWVDGMPKDFSYAFAHTYRDYDEKTKEILPYIGDGFRILDDADKVLDGEYFCRLFAEAVSVAEERNVRLYCGEYGVINRADPDDTLTWYQAIHTAFEKYGIGRAAWSYKEMDFGLSDRHMAEILEKIKTLL